jgi:hypothetical protein
LWTSNYPTSAVRFDEASEVLQKLTGVALSDKQIERHCHHHGQRLETELYEDQVEASDQTPYYVEMDGSMILTREESGQQGGWKEIKFVDFQINSNQGLKFPMVEQQVNSVFRTIQFDHVLIADEGKIATHFDQKLADVG